MVKDVDYNVKFFDAIKERDFQGGANADRYSTLLGTEMLQYVPIHGESFKVTSLIEVTFYDGRACDIEEIYHDADQSLYKNKSNGRNQFNIFSK